MPTETFFNLPTAKRNKIIDVAIDEFSTCYYHEAKVNRIVDYSDIAKGSFYQYFDDKKDLYKYILFEVVQVQKIEYLNEKIAKINDLGFFELLRQLYIIGLEFGARNPKLQAIASKFVKLEDQQFKEELLGESNNQSRKFFKKLLHKGIAQREVKSDLDLEVVSFVLAQFNLATIEYYFEEIQDGQNEITNEWKQDEIMEIVNKLLFIVENGIEYE